MKGLYPIIYRDGEKSVPLHECSYDQTQKLYDAMSDKLMVAMAVGSSGAPMLQAMLDEVVDRLNDYEAGLLKKPEPKKPSYSALQIGEDDD